MRFPLLTLILLGALCYFNAVGNPFVHDDIVFILQNPGVHHLAGIAEVFNKSSFAPASIAVANGYYRPFLDLVYRLEYWLFGPAPQGYHLLNIGLHLANAFLIFALGFRLTGRKIFSWCAAALFLVHPVQSEAVACISGISNLLFVFFLLASFLLYTRISNQASPLTWVDEAATYGGALVLFGCALLSKEQAIVLPLLLLLYEFCFPKIVTTSNNIWRLRLSGFLIVAGGYLMWRKIVVGEFLTSFVSNWGEFYLRLKSFPAMMLNHLQTVFWPSDLHYYRSYDILSPWAWPTVSFFLFLVVCFLVWTILPKNRQMLYSFGLGWFAFTLLPTTSIIPLVHEYSFIAAFEHFLYLPLAGLLWSLLIALDYFAQQIFRRKSQVVKKIFMAVGIFGAVVLTQAQTRIWVGEIALFEKAVKYENGMGRLHLLLAQAYYANGDFRQAKGEYSIGRDIMLKYLGKIKDDRIKPFYLSFLKDSLLGIAACEQALGNWQAACAEYEKIFLFALPDSRVENNLGVCAIRVGDLPKAEQHFRRALAMDANFQDATKNLEQVLKQKSSGVQ